MVTKNPAASVTKGFPIVMRCCQTVDFWYKSSSHWRHNFELEKIKNLIFWKTSKIASNSSSGPKKIKETHFFFSVFWKILDENFIFETKVTKFTPKYRNFRYFWNFKISLVAGNGRWAYKKSDGRCGVNLFVTKNFFDRQTQKFKIVNYKNIPPPKKGSFFLGGGGLGFDAPYNCNVTCAE